MLTFSSWQFSSEMSIAFHMCLGHAPVLIPSVEKTVTLIIKGTTGIAVNLKLNLGPKI